MDDVCVMVQYLGNRNKTELTMVQPASHPPPPPPPPQTRNQINHACVQPTEPTEGHRSRGGQGPE